MHALREMQRQFAATVFAASDAAAQLAPCCAGDPQRIREGIAAYRGNVHGTLAAAVVASYPVVGRIVGPAFLAAAARRYAAAVHSTSGDLNRYGGDFDRFLAADAAARELPYLADVARLEWCVQQLATMPASPPQQLDALAATPPQQWGALRLRLDPAHAVFASCWPLARIWALNDGAHHDSYAVDFAVAEHVLVQRTAAGVSVTAIGAGESALLDAVREGAPLAAAASAALDVDGDFDLSRMLASWIASRLLLSIS